MLESVNDSKRAGPTRQLISVMEVAQILSVGRSTVFHLIRAGELKSIRVGSRRLVPVSAILSFVESRLIDERKTLQRLESKGNRTCD